MGATAQTMPPLQVIEVVAMFKAGEAASDLYQKSAGKTRAEIGKEEYKAWLEKSFIWQQLAALQRHDCMRDVTAVCYDV